MAFGSLGLWVILNPNLSKGLKTAIISGLILLTIVLVDLVTIVYSVLNTSNQESGVQTSSINISITPPPSFNLK
jgi:hypothetical protein